MNQQSNQNLKLIDQEIALSAVLASSSNVVTDILPAYNQPDWVKAWIPSYLTNIESSEATTSLLALAAQCPFEGGNAVLKARHYLESYDMVFDSVWACNSIGERSVQGGVVGRNEDAFRLSPNPAHTVLQLQLEKVLDSGSYKILSLDGKMVQEGIIRGTSMRISIDDLSNGIFFISIQSLGKSPIVHKFIVQK